jgi:hypothetical protein
MLRIPEINSIFKVLVIIGSIIILFYTMVVGSFFFLSSDGIDRTAKLGDTLGGALGPLFACIGCVLTFYAFYVQFKANEDTRKQFRIQHQNSLEAGFETSFFARLELFKKVQKDVAEIVTFKEIVTEYELVYNTLVDYLRDQYLDSDPNNSPDRRAMYFDDNGSVKVPEWDKLWCANWTKAAVHQYVFEIIERGSNLFVSFPFIKVDYDQDQTYNPASFFRKLTKKRFYIRHKNKSIHSFMVNAEAGYASITNHYFLNLYHLLSYVVDSTAFNEMIIVIDEKSNISAEAQKEAFIRNKKKEYVSLIRAQMSSYETVFVYYNVLSDHGKKWCESQTVNGVSRSIVRDYDLFKNLYEVLVLGQNRIEKLPAQLKQYFHVDQGGTWKG